MIKATRVLIVAGIFLASFSTQTLAQTVYTGTGTIQQLRMCSATSLSNFRRALFFQLSDGPQWYVVPGHYTAGSAVNYDKMWSLILLAFSKDLQISVRFSEGAADESGNACGVPNAARFYNNAGDYLEVMK